MSEVSGHKEFLHDTLAWLSTLQTNSARPLPFMRGWRISIKSLLLLSEDLFTSYNARFLFTSRLNQNCIENLFSIIRGKGGHGDNPSPRQFRLFVRQAMVDSILLQSTSSNCLEDGDHFLLTLNTLDAQRVQSQAEQDTPDMPQGDPSLVALAFSVPGENLSQQEENVLMYISGYIARKIRHKMCPKRADLMVGELQGTPKETLLTLKQLPDLEGGGLVIPSPSLVSVVEQLEAVFKTSDQLLRMKRVRHRLFQRLEKEARSLVCPQEKCDPGGLVVNLFLNIRLHFTLRDNNRHFAAASGRQNRKMLKLQHL